MSSQSIRGALSRLTGTGFRIYFILCLVFAVLTAFFCLWLSALEIAAVLVISLVIRSSATRQRDEMMAYLDSVSSGVDSAARRTVIAAPLPLVIFRPGPDEIVWSNDLFLQITGDRDHIFETSLTALVPGFQSQWLLDGKQISPDPVPVGERQYLVYGNLVSAGEGGGLLATTYWVDVTEYASIYECFLDTRPVLAILQVDNYEDLSRGVEEGEHSLLRTQINNCVSAWLEPAQGMLCRYDRDHYLFLMEAGRLQDFYRRKFSILEEIRRIQSPNGVAATLSIGIGRDAESPRQLHEFASLALDMALSRGGDQVVVKNPDDFLFIGGRSKETERRTKVKSRVTASSLSEMLTGARQVIIMGHKFPDLDVLGAVAGMCAICRKKEVPAKIVRAPSPYPAEPQTKALASLELYRNAFISPEEARLLAGPETIVVVVDTSRPEQTQAPELLTSGAKLVVIDHHRRAASYIQNPALSFQDPYASSASELVAELDQYILDSGDLKKEEAEALLSGIMLDTKSFTMRTGIRTFELAAYLRKCGADTAQVNKFFQNDLENTVAKFHLIQEAKPYRDSIAIAVSGRQVGRPIAARAADELLNIAGIDASFVLFPEPGQACLSARSGGDLNVQLVTEALGGGGNATTAGAQFPGRTPEEILPDLKAAIDRYLDGDQ